MAFLHRRKDQQAYPAHLTESPHTDAAHRDALIELNRVVKSFKNAAGEYTVLKGIDAAFREGEFVSIVGRSGSGKSTLLNMMTGIDHPTSGSVRVDGVYLHTMQPGPMSVWRGKSMGIVFQFFQLLPMLTLLENVMLPMDFCDMYSPAAREPRAMDLLKMVGLEGFEHHYPAAVAGGQQQSAAVARALANDPPMLVADEPTGNLDSRTAERILIISDGELINEAISRALPGLPHSALLQISRAAHPCAYPPGPLTLDESGPEWLLVTRGVVEGLAAGRGGTQVAAERIEAGAWISRADLRAAGKSLLGLRAAGPVEALVADALPDSKELRAVLETKARERAALYTGAAKQKGERRGI